MEFYREILIGALKSQEMAVTFPGLSMALPDLVEMKAFQALKEIKAIIEDDSLTDFDCVEMIVRVFELLGSNGGFRHDFG